MIKYILTILVLFTFFCGYSQKFIGHIYGGATFSQIDGDNLGGYKKLGFTGGFGVEYPLSENLSFQGELAFIQKGVRETDLFFLVRNINYVSTPLFFKYYLFDKLALEGGLAIDILVNATQDTGAGPIASPTYENVNPTTVAGISFEFAESWSVNARHLYSVSRINRFYRQFNNTVVFSIRYRLWEN